MSVRLSFIQALLFSCASLILCVLLGTQMTQALVGPSQDGETLSSSVVMVLKSVKGRASFCTGVFLENDIVLTAAHCVAEPEEMIILFRRKGSSDQFFQVRNVKKHPQYNPQSISKREISIDLALVYITSMEQIDPIPLEIETDYQPSKDSTVLIAGFGQSNEQDQKSDGQLRQAEMRIRKPLSNVLLWMESGSKVQQGACSGDSGGPIMDPQTRRILAITAWASGSKQNKCGSLTQGILLKLHVDWIRTTTNNLKRQ